jgi:hypothetical protein
MHVRSGVQAFKKITNRQIPPDCISWFHCEQDVPDKNKKISDRTRRMTGVDPSTKYEKPRQDVGVFSFLISDFCETYI